MGESLAQPDHIKDVEKIDEQPIVRFPSVNASVVKTSKFLER
jgi:hypothetical protein